MTEDTAITMAEHLQGLAGNVDDRISIAPCRIERGHWAIHITDGHNGDWYAGKHDEPSRSVANRIRWWLLAGA